MDKISSILPSSPRTRAVSTDRAQPARPGAPRMGRPEGKNSLGETQAAMAAEAAAAAAADKLNFSERAVLASGGKVELGNQVAQAAAEKTYDRNSVAKRSAEKMTESAKTAVAKDLAAKFFMESPKSVARQNSMAKSEQVTEDMSENFAAANSFRNEVPVARSTPLEPLNDLTGAEKQSIREEVMAEMAAS